MEKVWSNQEAFTGLNFSSTHSVLLHLMFYEHKIIQYDAMLTVMFKESM